MQPNINLLKPKEVAQMFSVGTKTIQRWTKLGKVNAIHMNARTIRYNPVHINEVIGAATINVDATLKNAGGSE